MSFTFDLRGAFRIELASNELGGIEQRRVLRIYFHLGDDGCDLARSAGTSKCVLQRLLDHVADPPGSRCDEHAEGKWRRVITGDLVANELVTDLRPIAVYDAYVPAVERELDDGAEA